MDDADVIGILMENKQDACSFLGLLALALSGRLENLRVGVGCPASMAFAFSCYHGIGSD